MKKHLYLYTLLLSLLFLASSQVLEFLLIIFNSSFQSTNSFLSTSPYFKSSILNQISRQLSSEPRILEDTISGYRDLMIGDTFYGEWVSSTSTNMVLNRHFSRESNNFNRLKTFSKIIKVLS